jgi:hypothetical protein
VLLFGAGGMGGLYVEESQFLFYLALLASFNEARLDGRELIGPSKESLLHPFPSPSSSLIWLVRLMIS